jgi:serine/threonine-protein kinase RsbW
MPTTGNQPPDAQDWYRTFPGTPEHLCAARRFVRAHLPCHPDAELVASELATNTVVHTASGQPGGTFGIRIQLRPDDTARMEFDDAGGPADFATPQHDREGGRGLTLVQALTTDWGVHGDAAGRTVWAELPQSPAQGIPHSDYATHHHRA